MNKGQVSGRIEKTKGRIKELFGKGTGNKDPDDWQDRADRRHDTGLVW
ncbi:hypothetical protein CS8_054950 [Cupriavidus sp. 8B]